ncbi:protein-tyrosine phosphatase-like protein [Cantharellus anzutake]|uniref:protein-tyrosine phosphatase-like protein n=1 Tax=Cantharellus anzutake TaxID=1750568 RepID=UPI0019085C68|nr:protein-tyrosine phosphatase-like protein [Cantharellus anzutake]KAF8338997.1 protein-tyrosine phosphatase-like protein [Cantharellus anzutake]
MGADNLPEWLKRFQEDEKHRTSVLRKLKYREDKRVQYRTQAISHEHSEHGIDEAGLQSFYSVQMGQRNIALNRYFAIEPYDRGCCMVNSGPSGGEQVYLNGNWVRERAGGMWWLATQAPLPSTMYSFFALCTPLTPPHQRIRTIVRLTVDIERGRRKAHPYIPNEPGDGFRFTPPTGTTDTSKTPPTIEVTLLSRETLEDAQLIQSTLQVRLVPPNASSASNGHDGADFGSIVKHFHFDGWPDHGLPNTAGPIIHLAKEVDKANRAPCSVTTSSGGNSIIDTASPPISLAPSSPEVLSSIAPILAHCSAGIGRTGTFIAISSVLRANGLLDRTGDQLDPSPPPSAHSPLGELNGTDLKADIIAQEVDSLREQRPGMLEWPEQTEFVYHVLAEALSNQKVD